MKNVLNFAFVFLLLGVFSCSPLTEDNNYKPQAYAKSGVDLPSNNTVGYYQNGETTLLLEADVSEQIFNGIMESEGLNGIFIDASIDDLVNIDGSDAYLVFYGELDNGTHTSYGLTLDKAPGEAGLITYTLGDTPPQMERSWNCKNNGCSRCKVDRTNLVADGCHCRDTAQEGCDFSQGGGSGAWAPWVAIALTIYKIFHPE